MSAVAGPAQAAVSSAGALSRRGPADELYAVGQYLDPNAALLHIQGTLSMTDDEVGWVFTSYIAASAITLR